MNDPRTPQLPLHQQPLGGPILTRSFLVALIVFLVAVPVIVWRFAVGLGPSTALSDGYPWGFWIAFDVVTGTALASGGLAVAFLVYLLNRWRYHALVRPALLTAAVGYTVAVLALVVDVGRPWNFWKVPVSWRDWNFNSALLEVALCVAAYTLVLWIELSPAFLERLAGSGRPRARRFAERSLRAIRGALPWIVTIGLVLPMMHQSSLGTLMVLAGKKLHPLWQTPILPVLFLVSCFAMGIGAVLFESVLSSHLFRRPQEGPMLQALGRIGALVMAVFLALRVYDLAVRGTLGLAFQADSRAVLLWIEMALFLFGAILLAPKRPAPDPGVLLLSAFVLFLAGGLYRFDTFIVAFDPGPGWSYFPSVSELVISAGFLALAVMTYQVLVKRLPVLRGKPPRTRVPGSPT